MWWFASRAYRGSRNLRAVQTLLGHTSLATTRSGTRRSTTARFGRRWKRRNNMKGMDECHACGEPLSLEVGVTRVINDAGLGDLYCAPCAPHNGKGYTLSDLQRMREESAAARAAREMSLMDRVSPDVYFAVKAVSEKKRRSPRRG